MLIKLRQLPNELWMQALGHLNRHDVVDKLDFLWDRHFMPILCAWLLEYKRWQLARLQFCPPQIWQPNMFSDWPTRMSADARLRRSWDGKGWKFVPIAPQEEPMPEKVDGFELIDISYMDPTVLLFLSKVQPLFEHVNLKFCFVEDERDEVGAFIGNLMPMVKSVDTMAVCLPAFFQLHGYHSATLFGVKVLEFLAQDLSDEVTEMLVCWLFTPREDGEPRMLILSRLANAPGWAYNKFVRKLRRFFLRELTPCSFFIRLPTGVYENRWVNNERTGEDLRVEKYGVIIRCAETREGGRVDERVVPVLNWRWHNQGRRIALSSTRGNIISVEDDSDDDDDMELELEEPCCSNKLSHLGPERLE